jgi:hypothetical protein
MNYSFHRLVEDYLQISYGESIFVLTNVNKKQWKRFKREKIIPDLLFYKICFLVGEPINNNIDDVITSLISKYNEEIRERESQGFTNKHIISILSKAGV